MSEKDEVLAARLYVCGASLDCKPDRLQEGVRNSPRRDGDKRPSLVAKSAIPSDGNWAGFWGSEALDQKLRRYRNIWAGRASARLSKPKGCRPDS